MDDYKRAESDNKDVIFNAFMDGIWNCGVERRYCVKKISYTVLPKQADTELGRVFEEYSEVSYKYFASKLHSNIDYKQYIRQKINNMYSRMCDSGICTNQEYINKLKTAKRLYFRYIAGDLDLSAKQLRKVLSESHNEARRLKEFYAKQKIHISWDEYCSLVTGWLRNCFNNYKPLLDDNCFKLDIDVVTEDNYCVAYFCKSLQGELLKYQKQYYGVRDHKKYGRCIDCGCLYERKNKDTNSKRCDKCRKIHRREYIKLKRREYVKNYKI